MSHLDSDLEEGEILDDSPSSPYHTTNTIKNYKKLPRRYVLHENKSTHRGKHKKDCKYAIRYHARKLAKLKKVTTKLKDCHKKSCSHKNVYTPAATSSNHDGKSVAKHIIPKNGHTHTNHTLVEEIKNPFKEHNVYRRRSKSKKFDRCHSELENVKTVTNCTFSEILSTYKSVHTNQKDTDDSLRLSNQFSQNSVDSFDVIKVPKSDCDEKGIFNDISPKSPEVNSGESEDEEELRRIALATCAKRVTDTNQLSENVISENRSETSDRIYIVPESSENKLSHISCQENSNEASDNYDVIDMDLDEEIQNTFKIPESDNLFVIDTEPHSNYQDDFQKNSVCESQTVEDGSDDEFYTDILRAELINNLLRKRAALSDSVSTEKPSNITGTDVPFMKPNKHAAVIERTPNVNTHPDKPDVKFEASNSPKRLIISLNEESSTEESEQEEQEKVNPSSENPVASIVALISDIRQKSDSTEKNSDHVNSVPGALSCLSKAQQEEYNSLMKILAKKKKVPNENHEKNDTVHSPLNDLKLLEKKLLAVRVTLNKKKELMTCLSKEVTAKKYMYMKSKLTAQHLKEQYVAAEKVRRAKLQTWSKSCKNFDVAKKSVSDLETKITQIQNLCSKIGASIQGQNYNLPTKTEHSC